MSQAEPPFPPPIDTVRRLSELTTSLWSAPTLDNGLRLIVAAAIDLMRADFGNLQLMDAGRQSLTIAAHQGFSENFLDRFRVVSADDDSACGRALRTGARVAIEDVETDEGFAPYRPAAREAGYRAVQSTPLFGRHARVLGMLSTHFRRPHLPSDGDLECLDLYARQAAAFIERCQADERLRENEARQRDAGRDAEERLAAHARELEHRAGQLQRLASELTLAEQHAREELAKTLHDDLQQLLFSTKLRLSRLAASLMRREDGGALLEQARQDLDEAIASTRSFVKELFPPMLHDAGLGAALAWLAGWAQDKYGLRVLLTVDPGAGLERRNIRTLVFASVKELLFNVVKHAQTLEVAIDLAQSPDGEMRLAVVDRGAGFDPARVFAPDRRSSTGIGLFSIRERLAIFGGRLELESAPGDGARFTIVVPRPHLRGVHAAAAAGQPEAATGTHLSPARHPRPLTIVIADDHVQVRDGLRQLFDERAELRVVGEAATGGEAVALADALRPDVIVMDVGMPELDGVEATRQIRAAHPGILIFGLSNQERIDGLSAIEAAGAVGYFNKDEDAPRLLERLLAIHSHGDLDAGAN